MTRIDGQPVDGVYLHFADKGIIPACGQRQLSRADLDGDFPQAGHAEMHIVRPVEKEGPGGLAETRIIGQQPEKSVGVDQDFHSE